MIASHIFSSGVAEHDLCFVGHPLYIRFHAVQFSYSGNVTQRWTIILSVISLSFAHENMVDKNP